ncbi:thiamine biosynthesis lipoprotein ApbE [Formosa agariphila KMM 3901]|uniref:FAD:protein FMN transferase n=1 Tax=Formosa agariphila (strain DSM 15362 / KCTC 12365 / LMG 23005 / KMM 3901 / M-2Alg 35-1) TaxID=1347342 RepID=T2KJP5_FORAG|nr:FAD:protein FMN transferase [Formosa agariphila]CDF78214.1 thiamine biosynthesis lipoprotein ApbE [Formosa agariphila KMM 3901]
MKQLPLYILLILFLTSCHQTKEHVRVSGAVFGTSYSVQYFSKENINYKAQFDSLFNVLNQSMSTYIEDSDISKLNRNELTFIDDHFAYVFDASKEIYKETDGAFDPTIGVLVNAWNFGPAKEIIGLDSLKIDSLLLSVGLDKVHRKHHDIIKDNPNTFIDFNAIAKGYCVDVIGRFLESKNISNYLVEIGGEIRAVGMNMEKNSPWKVGVEMPHFDGTQSLLKAIELKGQSMATSGTYRKFKVDNEGNKYSHIIDAHTGFPSKTNLLSISVIASNCMTADAYATAFKTMGIEHVKSFLSTHPELSVFLIFENDKQELETLALNGFPE